MVLDLVTLHFSSAASRCAYVLVFFVLALSQRHRSYVWLWMGSMASSMAGSLIMMSVPPDALPPVSILMMTHPLYCGSLVLSWAGLRSFFGRPVPIGLAIGLVALPTFLYPVLLETSPRLAIAGVLTCCVVLAALAASETLRRPPDAERLWSQHLVSVAFGFFACVFVLSIVMLLVTDRPLASAESARFAMILDQVVGVFIYFGYVAMVAEQANRNLLHLAETDPLTGLANRRGLLRVLPRRVPPGRRSQAGVLILDIDHFKAINDRHGHEGGDLVLAAFAVRVRSVLRSTDLLARWGGEEFLVVVPGTTGPDLLRVAEQVRANIAETPFLLPLGALPVTVSIGAAAMWQDGTPFEAITLRADAALYEAKAQGRNRVCLAPASPPERPARASSAEGAPADLRPAGA